MSILNDLSSQKGDKTEESNRKVTVQCISNPDLIIEIIEGLSAKDKKLQSDCAEVCTMIAEKNPDLIVPFAEKIIPLITTKETKTRWEIFHTLLFIADKIPGYIFSVLAEIEDITEKDKSTIVRDYASETIANYAKAGKEHSEKAFIILKKILKTWEEKHAKQVFIGFNHILIHLPQLKNEIGNLVRPYLDAKKKVVAKEAVKILKHIEK